MLMKNFGVCTLAAVFALTACSGSENSDPIDNEDVGDSNSASDLTATYRVTFEADWSVGTHPLNFPSDPHFSGLVGAVHNEQVQFWMSGQLASDGIKLMAETGGKSSLLAEVQEAIENGYAVNEISGNGIGTSPDVVSVEFEVSRDYPQISLVSMVAPSPDWFVGIHNYSLLDSGEFIASRSVDLAVYDAGTDSGSRYTSADVATELPEPIQLLSSQPEDSPFVDGRPIVGRFIIEKL